MSFSIISQILEILMAKTMTRKSFMVTGGGITAAMVYVSTIILQNILTRTWLHFTCMDIILANSYL